MPIEAVGLNYDRIWKLFKKGSRELLFDELGQLGFAQGAYFCGCELSIFEQHEGWNTANAKFGGDVAILIHIEFGDLQFALVGGCGLVQNGGDHFAWTTPLGPKVDQDRLGCVQDCRLESGIRQVLDKFVGHVDPRFWIDSKANGWPCCQAGVPWGFI
jgi:hypothetical protein